MATTLLEADLLTPFYYHGLYAMDGSATDPNVITDTALVFALQAVLLGSRPLLRGKPDYRADLNAVPWRTSLLMGRRDNHLLPPLRRAVDMEREGGRSVRIHKNMSSGFYKNQFFTHSVKEGARYRGLLIGPDPFRIGDCNELILRIGVGRMGLLRLRRANGVPFDVRLNTATARLFDRQLDEEYRILDTIRPSKPYTPGEAEQELDRWSMNGP